MKPIFIALMLIAVVTAGCTTTVNLAVKNADLIPMNVAVDIKNKAGASTERINVGSIPPGGGGKKTFEVQDGGSFVVSGFVPSGVKVFNGQDVMVAGDKNPFEKRIILKSNYLELDDHKALKILSKSFKRLGADPSAIPLGLETAVENMIGALVVAKPMNNNNKTASPKEVLYTVAPGAFGVYQMSLKDVSFPKTKAIQKVVISGSASEKASSSYGALAHFGNKWDKNGVYELKWVLKGFGQIEKKESAQNDSVTQFSRLSNYHKNQIQNIVDNNSTAKIYFINKAFVMKRAQLFIKKAKKLSAGVVVDEATVVKGSAAYSFRKNTKSKMGYGPVVINYWGDEYSLIELPKSRLSSVKTLSDTNVKQLISEGTLTNNKEISFLLSTGRSVQFWTKEK